MRDLGKQIEILDNIKQTCSQVVRSNFNNKSTQYDIGYWQAHKDMQARIDLMEK